MSPGEEVLIYEDYQTELINIGRARLLRRARKSGPTFILEDMSDNQQVVYTTEYWFVDWIDNPTNRLKTRYVKIRSIHGVGNVTSNTHKDSEDELLRLPIDKFLSVNGIEVF